MTKKLAVQNRPEFKIFNESILRKVLCMSRARINMIKEINNECSGVVIKSLENISEEQINWKPAKESRSIYEIAAHLVRVNIYFLRRLGYEIITVAPKNSSISELTSALTGIKSEINNILDHLTDDEGLKRNSVLKDAKKTENLAQLIPHFSQHYLYHYAQMVYLRRAQDRGWDSPVEEWEKITYLIGSYLNTAT
jgi:uncharacterized damage-inducible protein DinB